MTRARCTSPRWNVFVKRSKAGQVRQGQEAPLRPRARLRAVSLAALALAFCGPQIALAQTPTQRPAPRASIQEIAPGEVIVRFKPHATSVAKAAAFAAVRATPNRKLLLPDTEVVRVEKGKEAAAAAALARNKDVLYAEPNRILHIDATPKDGRFADLWALNNTGQPVGDVAGTPDADIDAPEAWNLGRGLASSVRVAVIDTGVAMDHPEFAARIFTNPGESGEGKETNGVDDDGNGKIDDVHGWDFSNDDNDPTDDNEHGTHIAGTIAAAGKNRQGVVGVASFPTVSGPWLGPEIIPIKVLNAAGTGSYEAIADGIVYAGMMGARIANASLSGPGTSRTIDYAIASQPNTLYIVPAGNDGSDTLWDQRTPCVPATLPDVPNKLCVAATDQNDQLAITSNYGAIHVDLAAPGVSILSTLPTKAIFFEDFENGMAGRWTSSDPGQAGSKRWGLTNLAGGDPTQSITDSPGAIAGAAIHYEDNQDNWARTLRGVNLTGGRDCELGMRTYFDTEYGHDPFTVEASRSPLVPESWRALVSYWGLDSFSVSAPFPAEFNGQPGVFLRLRMRSDGAVNDDGVYVDDITVTCFGLYNASSYGFRSGTSTAAPQVSGAAAFLFTKFPAASVADVADKILRGVDKLASLDGRVLTGGRLNLYKAAAESTASVAGGVLTFTGGMGESNAVTAASVLDGGVASYRIADPYATDAAGRQTGSRIVAGAGCASVDDTTVDCPAAGVSRIVLYGRDGGDTLDASAAAIPVTLVGGWGDDTLIGGAAGDRLIGGRELTAISGAPGMT